MTEPGPSYAAEAADRLWANIVADEHAPHRVAGAVARMLSTLDEGLARWIGGGGYRALFDRSIAITRARFPWLATLPSPDGVESDVRVAVETFGTAVASAGFKSLLATLIELLGRIVGEEMAVRLVEQAAMPKPREAAKTDMEVERDG